MSRAATGATCAPPGSFALDGGERTLSAKPHDISHCGRTLTSLDRSHQLLTGAGQLASVPNICVNPGTRQHPFNHIADRLPRLGTSAPSAHTASPHNSARWSLSAKTMTVALLSRVTNPHPVFLKNEHREFQWTKSATGSVNQCHR